MKPDDADIRIFEGAHLCERPQADDEVNIWGGLKCLTCRFEVVVRPHLAPAYFGAARVD